MYDFYLGGKDNYAVDREAAQQVLHAAPEGRDIARANRAFLHPVPLYFDTGIGSMPAFILDR